MKNRTLIVRSQRFVVGVLTFSLFSASIAPAIAQNNQAAQNNSQGCNTAGVAILGALAGALLGGKNHRAVGAVAGGGLAAIACAAYNYRTQQVRSSQQVSQEYVQSNGGQLPPQAMVSSYQTKFDPTAQIQAGGSSNLDSRIVVVPGADGVPPLVEEEITIFGPDGKPLKTSRKPANSNGQGGEYQTQFSFTMPQGVPQGVYPFKTNLYLNGQIVQQGGASLQVV